MNTTKFRVAEAAALLGVSDDTVRRWAADGRLSLLDGDEGVKVVDGRELAAIASQSKVEAEGGSNFSVRNRMKGIVTAVKTGDVMSQVDIQAGPFRLVSLISTEAVEESGVEVGKAVFATAKATNVGVEIAS